MNLHDHAGIKMTKLTITSEGGWGSRQVWPVSRDGQHLGYVARSLTRGGPSRAGWSYCTEDTPELPCNWTKVGPGSTREQAVDHLLSALSPSASWLD